MHDASEPAQGRHQLHPLGDERPAPSRAGAIALALTRWCQIWCQLQPDRKVGWESRQFQVAPLVLIDREVAGEVWRPLQPLACAGAGLCSLQDAVVASARDPRQVEEALQGLGNRLLAPAPKVTIDVISELGK